VSTFSIARILLLCLPLFFHSYTGTALRCPFLYLLVYWGSLTAFIIHIIWLTAWMNSNDNAEDKSIELGLRHIGSLLALSIVSTISHLVMVYHVRSTAPSIGMFKRPSVYYQIRRSQNEDFHESNEPHLMHAMTGTYCVCASVLACGQTIHLSCFGELIALQVRLVC
jgi:hypothetical protein